MVVVFLAAIVGFAGCGKMSSTQPSKTEAQSQVGAQTQGSDTGSTDTTTTSTHVVSSAFVAQADAICRRLHEKRAGMHAASRQELKEFGAKLAAYEKVALSELDKVTPSSALAADWRVIVNGAHALAAYTPKIIQFELESEEGKVNVVVARRALATSEKLRTHVLETAKRDGFKYCSVTI